MAVPNGGSDSPTSLRRIDAKQRQAKALQLRMAGVGFEQIAKQLGYKDPTGAHKAVMAALRETLQEPAEEYRTLETNRLDALLRGLWLAATKGDVQAIYGALAILDRRAKLTGLYQPEQVDIRVKVEQLAETLGIDKAAAVAEAERIIRGKAKAISR